MQRIVNMKHKPKSPYIYGGRKISYNGEEIPASPIGNPFTIRQVGRHVALDFFRRWLWGKIKKKDPLIMALLNAITEDTTIACWCCNKEGQRIYTDEERCHLQIVFKAWRYLKQTGQLNGSTNEVPQEQTTGQSPTS